MWSLHLVLLLLLMLLLLMILLFKRVGRDFTIVMGNGDLSTILLADVKALAHEVGSIIGGRSHLNSRSYASQLCIFIGGAGSVLQTMMVQHLVAL